MGLAQPLPLPPDGTPDEDRAPEPSGDADEHAAGRRSPLGVLLALLLAAETLIAAVLSIGKVMLDFQTNTGFPGSPTHYVLWLALVTDVVFFGAAALLAVATVAVWQDAWGRDRLVGPTKRAAVWGAMFVQVMLLIPFEPLFPRR